MPIVVADSHIAYRNDRTNKYEMHYSLNTHTRTLSSDETNFVGFVSFVKIQDNEARCQF